MVVDLTGRPQWMLQYRIQEEKNIPVCMSVCMYKYNFYVCMYVCVLVHVYANSYIHIHSLALVR